MWVCANWGTLYLTSLQRVQEKCIEKNIPLYMIICWLHRSLWHREQGNAMEHPLETRMPWLFCWAHIYLAYRNESVGQLKRRTLGIIWSWEQNETGLCSCCQCFWFFFLWSCLMPNSTLGVWIQSRLGGQTCSISVNLSLQQRTEIFYYVSSYLLMVLPLWHTTTKILKK